MKKLIVLGVCGSIAAVRSFDLCRELRRAGFDVLVVMSGAAQGIITKDAMEFASGKTVIDSLSGKIEHVKLFGKNGKASLFLVAPATANTISKIALGIDDTPITTIASVAIGAKKPVLIAPAMHAPMYDHPIVAENLQKLESRNVKIISPLMAEGKAKLAEISEIVFEVERALCMQKFTGKKILITSGAISEKIDEIRAITNMSSGELGTRIFIEAKKHGAEVKMIGNRVQLPYIKFENADFANELEEKVLRELENGYDYFFCPAAIPDFSVKKSSGKISSSNGFELKLKPRAKLIDLARKKFPKTKIVAFKALWGKSEKEIEKIAQEFLKNRLHAVGATDLQMFAHDAHKRRIYFCSAKKRAWIRGTKEEIARKIIESL